MGKNNNKNIINKKAIKDKTTNKQNIENNINKIYEFWILTLSAFLIFSAYKYKTKMCVIEKNVTEVKEVVNENYVFLGDSITDFYDVNSYFSESNVVNSGINGNKTNDILDDMYNRVYRYNPNKVIILIGINNLLYTEDDTNKIIEDIKEISENITLKLPNCKIYIQSIYPMNDDWRKEYNSAVPDIETLKEDIKSSNEQIKKLCNEKKYVFIDLFKKLKDENEEFDRKYTNDGLHPNEEGYKIITNVIKEYLN